MSLFQKEQFDAFALTLPAATLHDQWKARVAKVGGKMFMALGFSGLWENQIIFKTTEFSFMLLKEQEGVRRAPYATAGHWLAIREDALKNGTLSEDDLKLYLGQSHQIISQKLTKTLRQQLGLL